MLGNFWYRIVPPPDDVVVELCWVEGERRAKVTTPCWISEHPLASKILLEPSEEYIGLPMAFSYGVLIAATAGAYFTISGDRSAWPSEWGDLIEGLSRSLHEPYAISH